MTLVGVFASELYEKYVALHTLANLNRDDKSTTAGEQLIRLNFGSANTQTIEDRLVNFFMGDQMEFKRNLRETLKRVPRLR